MLYAIKKKNEEALMNKNNFRRVGLLLVVLMFGSCASGIVAPPGLNSKLLDIKVNDTDTATIITIKTSNLPQYAAFKTKSPPSISVDLASTDAANVSGSMSVENGFVKKIAVTQLGESTGYSSRVTITLEKPLSYTTSPDGNDIVITVSKTEEQPAAEPALQGMQMTSTTPLQGGLELTPSAAPEALAPLGMEESPTTTLEAAPPLAGIGTSPSAAPEALAPLGMEESPTTTLEAAPLAGIGTSPSAAPEALAPLGMEESPTTTLEAAPPLAGIGTSPSAAPEALAPLGMEESPTTTLEAAPLAGIGTSPSAAPEALAPLGMEESPTTTLEAAPPLAGIGTSPSAAPEALAPMGMEESPTTAPEQPLISGAPGASPASPATKEENMQANVINVTPPASSPEAPSESNVPPPAVSAPPAVPAPAEKKHKAEKEIAMVVPAAPVTPALRKIKIIHGIVVTPVPLIFKSNEAVLSKNAEEGLKHVADYMNEHEHLKLIIQGYSDAYGPEAYNKELSYYRTLWVKMALERYGVSSGRLMIKPMGTTKKFGQTKATEARNRRVVLSIVK